MAGWFGTGGRVIQRDHALAPTLIGQADESNKEYRLFPGFS